MQLDIPAALDEFTAALTEAGLRAESEPKRLNPPCAWVTARSITHEYLDGTGTLNVYVYLIAPDTGTANALGQLTRMMNTALGVFTPTEDTSTAERVAVATVSNLPLPAYRMATEITLRED